MRENGTICLGNPLTIYRGLSGPPGPKPRKSLEKVSWGLRPRNAPRVWKRSRKSLSGPFRDFLQTLQTFSRPFPDSRKVRGPPAPGDFFSDFFGVSGPEGPRDPCKWSTGSQHLAFFCFNFLCHHPQEGTDSHPAHEAVTNYPCPLWTCLFFAYHYTQNDY